MRCPSCERENEPGKLFCFSCRSALSPAAPASRPRFITRPRETDTESGRWILGLVAAVLIAIAVGLFFVEWQRTTRGPSDPNKPLPPPTIWSFHP